MVVLNSTASSVPHHLFNIILSQLLVHLQLIPPSSNRTLKRFILALRDLQFPDSFRHRFVSIMGISEGIQVGTSFPTEVLTCLASANLVHMNSLLISK